MQKRDSWGSQVVVALKFDGALREFLGWVFSLRGFFGCMRPVRGT